MCQMYFNFFYLQIMVRFSENQSSTEFLFKFKIKIIYIILLFFLCLLLFWRFLFFNTFTSDKLKGWFLLYIQDRSVIKRFIPFLQVFCSLGCTFIMCFFFNLDLIVVSSWSAGCFSINHSQYLILNPGRIIENVNIEM